MAGSLRELSPGKYQFRVSVGRDPASGTYRYISRTIRASSKKELEREQRRILAEVDEERHKGSTLILAGLLDRWIEHVEPDQSPKYSPRCVVRSAPGSHRRSAASSCAS